MLENAKGDKALYAQANAAQKVTVSKFGPPNTASIREIVSKGTQIAKLLKDKNPDKSWPEISDMFVEMKKESRAEFPLLDDMTILKFMHEEIQYN